MTIRHHPAASTLISHASGTLPVSIAGLVACHLSICPECRKSGRQLERLGGLLLETAEPAALSEAAMRGAEARLAEQSIMALAAPSAPADHREDPLLPLPLAHYLGMTGEELPWKRLVKGLDQYRVKLPRGAGEMRLLRARPRLRLFKHGHRGMELTMILKGAYRDETGEYHRGDVSDLAEDLEHQPKVLEGEECICIIASEGPARYSDLLPRLLQPFMGF